MLKNTIHKVKWKIYKLGENICNLYNEALSPVVYYELPISQNKKY